METMTTNCKMTYMLLEVFQNQEFSKEGQISFTIRIYLSHANFPTIFFLFFSKIHKKHVSCIVSHAGNSIVDSKFLMDFKITIFEK